MNGIGKLSRGRLSEVLRRAGGNPITAKTVSLFLGIPAAIARNFLSLWAKSGWIHRIRRGAYLPVDIRASSPDEIFADPWIIGTDLFSPCYVTGWSAAAHWGFTEQIFHSTVLCTERRINGKNQSVGSSRFLVKKTTAEKTFGLKTVWKEGVKIRIADPHKMIIDMLDDPSLGGGIRSVTDFLLEYLSSAHYNPEILLEYAGKMQNGAIFKRLGFLLSKTDPDKKIVIERCRDQLSKGYCQLDPTAKGNSLVKRWKIWVPEGLY